MRLQGRSALRVRNLALIVNLSDGKAPAPAGLSLGCVLHHRQPLVVTLDLDSEHEPRTEDYGRMGRGIERIHEESTKHIQDFQHRRHPASDSATPRGSAMASVHQNFHQSERASTHHLQDVAHEPRVDTDRIPTRAPRI